MLHSHISIIPDVCEQGAAAGCGPACTCLRVGSVCGGRCRGQLDALPACASVLRACTRVAVLCCGRPCPLQDGAILQLQHGQVTCGVELGLLLVEVSQRRRRAGLHGVCWPSIPIRGALSATRLSSKVAARGPVLDGCRCGCGRGSQRVALALTARLAAACGTAGLWWGGWIIKVMAIHRGDGVCGWWCVRCRVVGVGMPACRSSWCGGRPPPLHAHVHIHTHTHLPPVAPLAPQPRTCPLDRVCAAPRCEQRIVNAKFCKRW